MEGKAMLFKEFAGIDAFPSALLIKTLTIVETVKQIAPVFGGVEDIAAPRCFEIESLLRQQLDILFFTMTSMAVVTLAALLNALRLVNKSIDKVRIVINGAGAAGVAIARLLRSWGSNYLDVRL